jgi:hypothetical protein
MISDKNFLKFVYLKSSKMISSYEKIEDYPQKIKDAFNYYKNENNDYYVKICNQKLRTNDI